MRRNFGPKSLYFGLQGGLYKSAFSEHSIPYFAQAEIDEFNE